MVKDRIKLELNAHTTTSFIARAIMEAFVLQANMSIEEVNEIKTSISEAVENCIYHAYPDSTGKIYIIATLTDKEVKISVHDKGVGIPNFEQARMPLYSTLSDHSGMGFTIIESFMDDMTVKSTPGKGTTVKMLKKYKQK